MKKSAVVRMKLVNANPTPEVTGGEELPGKVNYFLGNDPKKWRTNVATYAKVQYDDVYPGIDLAYYGNQEGRLEHDFIVAPGADPKQIALGFEASPSKRAHEGTQNSVTPCFAAQLPRHSERSLRTKFADAVSVPAPEAKAELDCDGNLVIHTSGGDLEFHKPLAYQEINGKRKEVTARYALLHPSSFRLHPSVHFQVDAYDPSLPLIIDPVLVYSTYLGGSSNDYDYGIAVDGSGNAYVTGSTSSTSFPTVGPFQPAYGGGATDLFVAKLNPAGNALVYATCFGGSDVEEGHGIAVDNSGNAYVTGWTSSTNFPTVNPLQASSAGSSGDGFVAKLNPSGSALVYSTYLGGNGSDRATGIALDSSNNAYVGGWTTSTNFPTVNPIKASFTGVNGDAFVSKLNASGSALVYSTYLGGTAMETSSGGIAVDASGNCWVSGRTESSDFPTVNAVQTSNGGWHDAFVAKLNPAGLALVFSTYLGGSGYEDSYDVAADGSGNA